MNRNLWLLAITQGLFLANNVALIAINGLVGRAIAPYPWMATLPVMAYVVGGALSTGLVARAQTRWGRKISFQIGLLVALATALLAAVAVVSGWFWMLVATTAVAGYYSANGHLYRFAAAELADTGFREKAVSLVMAGGLLGAVIGPNLANQTRGLLSVPFAGAYVALSVLAVLAMLLVARIDFPPVQAHAVDDASARPLSEIARSPTFIIAVLAAAISYGVITC